MISLISLSLYRHGLCLRIVCGERSRPEVAVALRPLLACLSNLVSERRRKRAAALSHFPARVAQAHAGAGSHLRAVGRAGRRQRPGRAFSFFVLSAQLSARLLAGGMVARCANAGAQL